MKEEKEKFLIVNEGRCSGCILHNWCDNLVRNHSLFDIRTCPKSGWELTVKVYKKHPIVVIL